MVILVAFLDGLGPCRWPLGSRMVDLGCQGTDWVSGNEKEVLDAILLRDREETLKTAKSLNHPSIKLTS